MRMTLVPYTTDAQGAEVFTFAFTPDTDAQEA